MFLSQTVADVEGFLKYLDKAENEINTAEPISVDPETLRVQLRDHNVSLQLAQKELSRKKEKKKKLCSNHFGT
jgi:Leucine-rich repeat (LRR) protein